LSRGKLVEGDVPIVPDQALWDIITEDEYTGASNARVVIRVTEPGSKTRMPSALGPVLVVRVLTD
jgi:hypothetical protein